MQGNHGISCNQKSFRKGGLLFAGGAAGVVAKSVVAPFERIKIVCQTGTSTGMMSTFYRIVNEEGFSGFWKGNLIACIRSMPNKAILFGCNDMYKDTLDSLLKDSKLGFSSGLVSGSLAGATSVVLTYPLDLVRTRIAAIIGTSQYSGIVKTVTLTIKEEGFFALYRGIGPTLVGSLPYEGLKFGSYDVLKSYCGDLVDGPFGFLVTTACGAGAGMIATLLTYPNDTVKRRLQMQGCHGSKRIYKHSIDCFVVLLKTEGLLGWYRGLMPTMLRAVPNMGIQFAVYEVLKNVVISSH